MPLCANYGGTLQNWALQQALVRLGHEPVTMRFPVEYQGMTSLHYWIRVFPKQFIRFVACKILCRKGTLPLTIGAWRKSVKGMERFVNEHINVTEYLPNLSMDDVKRHGVEALIVGSDQIWRPVMYDAVKYYFLGFTMNSDILRIAYAPSVALDEWPYDSKTTSELKELSKKFSAISVREKSSVKLIKDNIDAISEWVLDPTMLLNKEDYLEVCKDVPQSKEHFVFAYILDMTEEKRSMAEQTAKLLGCSVQYLSSENVKAEDTIEKWLAKFRDSKFVVTDSYHGTVFSLIFQKQFYTFYNNYRGNARMDTLKELLGLEDRFLQHPKEAINSPIDYEQVESNINVMRNKSKKFLIEALSK